MSAVRDASYSVKDSARLRKVLEVILALGNYMNSGRKGLASGFKIQSLSRVSYFGTIYRVYLSQSYGKNLARI